MANQVVGILFNRYEIFKFALGSDESFRKDVVADLIEEYKHEEKCLEVVNRVLDRLLLKCSCPDFNGSHASTICSGEFKGNYVVEQYGTKFIINKDATTVLGMLLPLVKRQYSKVEIWYVFDLSIGSQRTIDSFEMKEYNGCGSPNCQYNENEADTDCSITDVINDHLDDLTELSLPNDVCVYKFNKDEDSDFVVGLPILDDEDSIDMDSFIIKMVEKKKKVFDAVTQLKWENGEVTKIYVIRETE